MLISAPPHIEWRLIAIKKLFLVVAADSSHWRSRSECTLCPQCGRSLFDLALILCAAAANGGSEPILPDAARCTNGNFREPFG
jgi:hypothetical protein